jgi:hypothetical protein
MLPIQATAEMAALLGVAEGSAHMSFRGTTTVEGEALVELSKSVFRGDMFEFVDRRRHLTPDRRPIDPSRHMQSERIQDLSTTDPEPNRGQTSAPIHTEEVLSRIFRTFDQAAAPDCGTCG